MTFTAPPAVNRFFAAMQVGAAAEAEMMALFTEDAVYVEPFSGRVLTHTGKRAIHEAMSQGWRHPLPDARIEVDRVEVDGSEVTCVWTCHSAALPGGRGRGENRFTLEDGRIARLETRILPSEH